MADTVKLALACILEDACVGSRRVQITLKDEGSANSKRVAHELMELVNDGQVKVSTGVYLALMGVNHSGTWMSLPERQFTMELITDKFDVGRFTQVFVAFIEFMETVD